MKSQSNIHVLSFLRSSVNAASMVVSGVGLVVMFGWFLDLPLLKSFIPGMPVMRFNTALCFILLGGALWFLQHEEPGSARKRIGKILAGLGLLISLLTLCEYLFGWNLGIDELFIRDLDSSPDLFPGRMSPIAVLCSSLSSIALLMIGSRISQYFSLTVIVLSLVTIMNFLFDFEAFPRNLQNTYSAVQAAGIFLILSLALLAARPTQGMMKDLSSDLPGSKAMRLLLPGIVILTVVMGWLVEWAESLGILDTSKDAIFLVLLLIFVYSPLIYFIARNINRAEEGMTYANRLYATLSQVNQAIVRVKNQQELFESICNIAVDFGKFRLAWIGLFDHDSGHLRRVAIRSSAETKLPFEDINVKETPFKEGLIGLALASGQAQFSDDLMVDHRMLHWREISLKEDFRSAAAVPIRQSGQITGFLNLYTTDAGFFMVKEEQNLLEEIGLDISFALDAMATESKSKQAEESLRASEHTLKLFVEHAPAAIAMFDHDMKYIAVSSRYVADYRLSNQNIIGLSHYDVFTEIPERWKEIHRRCLAGAIEKADEDPFPRADGTLDWVRWEMRPWHENNGEIGGIILFSEVVTERKQAETQIQRQLQRLKGLRTIDIAISSSFDIGVILDIVLQQVDAQLGVDAAAILLFNPQSHTMEYAASRGFHSNALHHTHLKLTEGYAGRAVRERLTIHIPDLLKTGGKLAEAMQLAKEDFVDYYGAPLIAKEGIKGVLEIYHRSPLNSDPEWLDSLDTLAGQAAIAIDNAQLFENLQRANAELEQRVTRRTEELNQTNSKLERASRTKDEFLATMSHELRTPLNSILGLSETLLEQRRDPLSGYQQRSLQIIASSGQHLLELINDILDLSKIEAGKFDYYPQIITLSDLCRTCLAFVHERATHKSITLTYEEETAVSKIYADPRRLKQILVNLLTNATKFTPAHGQVILQVRAYPEQDRIQFSVIDTGIGIAIEDLRQLFVPFKQVDSSLTRDYEGTGLGLALVQKLTDLHGGSVEVESEVGRGSRFTINLPLGQAMVTQQAFIESGSKPLNSEQAGKSYIPPPEAVDRGVILLAEDNVANVLTIGDYLESHGYEVVVAHNGFEAIERAEAISPDIILMDIQMPSMNGLEAIAYLRGNPSFANTPIIALTALAMSGDRERCLLAGASEYMSKPVSLKALKSAIRQLLRSA